MYKCTKSSILSMQCSSSFTAGCCCSTFDGIFVSFTSTLKQQCVLHLCTYGWWGNFPISLLLFSALQMGITLFRTYASYRNFVIPLSVILSTLVTREPPLSRYQRLNTPPPFLAIHALNRDGSWCVSETMRCTPRSIPP